MRKIVVTLPLGLAVAALCFCLPVAAQNGAGARTQATPPPEKSRTDRIVPDKGQVVGSTYTNEYFGLQLTIPEGWRIADDAVKRQMDEEGAALVAGDSAERRAQLKEAASKNINLLTIGKVLPAKGGSESAMLIMAAEAVPAWLLKTPHEYIGQVRRLLESSAMRMNVEAGTRSETIGGVEFAVIDVSSEQPGGLIKQKYYAMLKKGYALVIISTFASDQSSQAIAEVLKSVKFK